MKDDTPDVIVGQDPEQVEQSSGENIVVENEEAQNEQAELPENHS